ncbi:MAG: dephospho-CoA kinase [Candidatus Aminicenantes bacterium]|nr:dephospho-CoA kinase [Candidatus Aminicenantes bacterium]
MLRVALTGGIASGKSVVAEIFRQRGFHLFSADRAGRDFMAPGGPAYSPIVEKFGPSILAGNQTPGAPIDRSALAAILFSDSEAKRFVEGVVHPLTIAAMKAAAARLEAEGRTDVFVAESALTVEAGLVEAFDRIIVVHCDTETQVRRLMDRDGIGREAALARIRTQKPVEEKLRFADFAVDSSGEMEETIARAEAVASLLLDEARAGRFNP